MANLSKAIADTRKGKIIGELVSWGLYNIEIPLDKFKEDYEKLELPKECFHHKRTRTALTKAMKLMEGQGLIRKVSETETKIVYLLVAEHKDAEGEDITFEKKNTVIYDKTTKSIRFKKTNTEKESALKALFEKYQHLITGREISKTFVKLARYYGIPMSEGGGIYFIPVDCLPVVDKMVGLLKNTSGSILRLGISDQKEYREDVRKLVQKELFGELSNLNREARSLKKKKEESEGDLRGGLLTRRIKRAKAFSTRIDYFGDLGADEEGTLKVKAKKCLRRLGKLEDSKSSDE